MSIHRLAAGLTFLLAFYFVSSASAQVPSFVPKGIGFEAGGGHNEIMWWVENGDDGHRRQVLLAPNLRMHYNRAILGKVALMPFVGYNVTGGRSAEWEVTAPVPASTGQPTYRDAFRLRTFEAGSFVSYTFGAFAVGVGLKGSRIFAVRHKSMIENDTSIETQAEDRSDMFKTWSSNGGTRLEYGLGNLILAIEAWFGLAGIDDGVLSSVVHVRENHYRLLVGYRLK